jgi:hypothetical protein
LTIQLVNFGFQKLLLSHIASTFCLDAKSSKKIKAPEKWLKIPRAAFRRQTRFKNAHNF